MPSPSCRPLALAGALLLCAWPAPSPAEAVFPAIELREALARAARDNPSLARFPFRQRAAEAMLDQAGRRPNPLLGVELENALGSGALGGTGSAELTLSLSQVLEVGGKRGLRRDLAEADRALLSDELRLAELDIAAETARHFIAVLEAQANRDLAGAQVSIAARASAQVEERQRAGRSSAAETHKARAAVLDAELTARAAARELEVTRLELAGLFGAPQPDFGAARGDLFALPAMRGLADLEARLLDGPDLARFATEERRRRAEQALARSAARQDLMISGGLRRFQATGDTAFTFGLSLPLGLNDRNQGGIAAAQARLDELGIERDATRNALRVLLAVARERLAGSHDSLTLLRGDLLTEAEQALSSTEQGYGAGRLSWLELSDAQQQLLAVRAAAIRVAADHHRLRIELERLTGRAIDAP